MRDVGGRAMGATVRTTNYTYRLRLHLCENWDFGFLFRRRCFRMTRRKHLIDFTSFIFSFVCARFTVFFAKITSKQRILQFSRFHLVCCSRVRGTSFSSFAVSVASWFSTHNQVCVCVCVFDKEAYPKKGQVEPRIKKIVGKNIEAEAKVNVDRNWNTFTEKLRIYFCAHLFFDSGRRMRMEKEECQPLYCHWAQWTREH